MNSMKIGTYQMDTTFGLYLPEYTIPAPAVQTNFVKIIGRDGSVDLSNALGLHYDSRTWSLDFKCFDPTVNWHTLSSQVMNAIHGKRLNFEFDDDPDYFWTGRVSVQNYVSNHGTGTLKVTIVSDPFKYAKLSTIVTKTASTGTEYTGSIVTFNDGLIYDLSADIEPIQDLHGYDSPWVGTEQDKVPYNFRALPDPDTTEIGNSEIGKIVGGTVAWNQQYGNSNSVNLSVPDAHRTQSVSFTSGARVVSGHKYLFSIKFSNVTNVANDINAQLYTKVSGSNTIIVTNKSKVNGVSSIIFQSAYSGVANGSTSVEGGLWGYYSMSVSDTDGSCTISDGQLFDLTAMFGSTIADYIYTLETNNAGAGVAWFRKLFPKDYYAYDAGSLLSVKTSAHKEYGFNAYDNSTGRAKVVGGQVYQITGTYTALSLDGTSITPDASGYFTPAASGELTVTGGNATDTCIHLKWDGERDGEYEPYEANTYPLDDVELRGIPKLDASNNLYYDGDSYASDGTVTRKYGIVDLGTLSWSYSASAEIFLTNFNSTKAVSSNAQVANVVSGNYQTISADSVYAKHTGIAINTTPQIWIHDSNYTDKDVFAAAMSGVYLVYELATPTTESADPYTSPQSVSPYGTEEYVDAGVAAGTRDVAIPVGHETTFANICPITGRTGLNVYVGPTQDPDDATTYAVDWTSEAGTVYGGTLDVVTGLLTVDRYGMVVDGTSHSFVNVNTYWHISPYDYPVIKTGSGGTTPVSFYSDITQGTRKWGTTNNGTILFTRASSWTGVFNSVDELNALGITVVYELATPLTYQLTPQEVEALVGTNNVWSDGGNVTVAVVTPETLTNNGRAVVPTLTASADMVLKWGNYSASVQQGTSTIPQLILENGANLVYIIGTGSISFTWQEVSL